MAPFVGVSMSASLSDIINRFGMNRLLVLAMVPMIQTGCGLNFGLSLGVIGSLLGSTISADWLNRLGWFIWRHGNINSFCCFIRLAV